MSNGDKTGTQKNNERSLSQPGERDPVVNTEEQNKPINPGDRDYKETSDSADSMNKSNNSPRETKPDGGSEVENPSRVEGDDAESMERKIPNL